MAPSRATPTYDEELAHFMNIPWCRKRIEQPGMVTLHRMNNDKEGSRGRGKLFGETLNTFLTISHCIVLFRDPSVDSAAVVQSNKPWLPLTQCSVFYDLGEGICGFDNICHGGIQTTLLDDVAGVLGIVNKHLQAGIVRSANFQRICPETNSGMLDLRKSSIATQRLEVQFLRPLRVPVVVEVAAQVQEISSDGSQLVIEGSIQDGSGKKYATTKAHWTVMRSKAKI